MRIIKTAPLWLLLGLLISLPAWGKQTFSRCPTPQEIKYIKIPTSRNAIYTAVINGVGYSMYMFDVGSPAKWKFTGVQIVKSHQMVACLYQGASDGITLVANDNIPATYQQVHFEFATIGDKKYSCVGNTYQCTMDFISKSV